MVKSNSNSPQAASHHLSLIIFLKQHTPSCFVPHISHIRFPLYKSQDNKKDLLMLFKIQSFEMIDKRNYSVQSMLSQLNYHPAVSGFTYYV